MHATEARRASQTSASSSSPPHGHGIGVRDSSTSSSSSRSAAAAPPSAMPPPHLTPGARVVLIGLNRRQELNGQAGRLTCWDGQAQRWEFSPEDGGGAIKVRAENVQLVPPPVAGLQVPDEFRCCITQDIMDRPVITSDGHTYERVAIARWLEEHSTSPKTGQELPDRVLRPNHAMRAQIIAWRERHGLPPLPPWEPEPQETVQAVPQVPEGQSGGAPAVMVQTAQGTITLPLALFQGASGASEGWLMRVLQTNTALQSEILDVLRDQVGPGLEMPDGEELARRVAWDPSLLEIVMRWAHSDPEARAQVALMQGGTTSTTGGPNESPIFRAAREGECGVVEQLLGSHVNRERFQREISAHGDTLLHVASWYGHARLASMLLARGHPVHSLSRNRSTPLHYAAFRGCTEVVRVLVAERADLERKMVGGDAPIHQAAWSGHLPALSLLIEHRASLLAAKDNGDTPLSLAAFRGHTHVCRALLAACVTLEDAEGTSKLIMSRNVSGRRPLHAAAAGGVAEIVQMLLDAGAAVSAKSDNEETPLHLAAASGAYGAAEALVNASADLGAARLEDEHTPLFLAVLQGRARLTKLLVERGASLTADHRRDGMTPAHMAVIFTASAPVPEGEDASVLAVLLQARAEPNARARNGVTPLHLALGRFPQPAPYRSTALRLLLEHNADFEAPLRNGERPLHVAVGGNLRVEVAMLLEKRVDANAIASDGSTALHVAARHCARECAELLLRAGASPALTNSIGQIPPDVARQHGFSGLEHLLRRGHTGGAAAAAA